MTVDTRIESPWVEAAAALAAGRGSGAPDWIREIRAAGRERLAEVGLPGRKDEDWRFTNVTPIVEGGFRPVPDDTVAFDDLDLSPFAFDGLVCPHLVFVDGTFSSRLSDLGGLPDGVTVRPLAEAWRESPGLVRPRLGQLAKSDGESFTALNASLFEDGAFVHVAPGLTAGGVVRVLHVGTDGPNGSEPRMTHPRSLVVVGQGSEITVLEDRVSTGPRPAFVNSVTEIFVGANARAHYYGLARENEESFAVSTVHAMQERDSFFGSHSALLGGRLVRSNIYPVLAGTGCHSLLNGFYVPAGTQHHDTHMLVRHAAPHGDSRQFYRGILGGRAHAVFGGRIIVHEGAQKTDAKQTDMNLLLSDDAVIDTQPQLEIYADDVKCTHGATVGQLDPDAIFYMKARGIPEERARGLLVFAFVNEVLERMELEPVRDELAARLRARLPGIHD